MLERMSLLKIAMAAVFAASLAALPLTLQAQETTEPATKSDTPAKGKKKAAAKKSTATTPAEPKTTQSEPKSTPTETKKGRPLTAGQIAARERQTQCGAEWRGFSDEVKKQKGPTWPKYWSACNTRLKSEGQAKGKKA
jgi:hypothetical protein